MEIRVNASGTIIVGFLFYFKAGIIFNYKIWKLTLYNLGLIQSFVPNHGVLVYCKICFEIL